jgi:DnaJ-class molecular chaperone
LQGGIGDLVVVVKVVTPTRLTDEQRQCFELMRHLEKGDSAQNPVKKSAEPHTGLFDKIKDFLAGA